MDDVCATVYSNGDTFLTTHISFGVLQTLRPEGSSDFLPLSMVHMWEYTVLRLLYHREGRGAGETGPQKICFRAAIEIELVALY